MNAINVNGFKRISKQAAFRMFANGETFHICPSKMIPGGTFAMSMPVYGDRLNERLDAKRFTNPEPINPGQLQMKLWAEEVIPIAWDNLINEFNCYNACYETGYYPAFYVNEK